MTALAGCGNNARALVGLSAAGSGISIVNLLEEAAKAQAQMKHA
jgi:hypothetical protein